MSQQSEDADEIDEAYGGLSPLEGPSKSPFADSPSNLDVATPTLGSLSKQNSPAALGSVLSALSAAGKKNQGRRIMRGMTAEEESRRKRVERKMDEARRVDFRDLSHYAQRGDQGGIGRIGAVHRKIQAEWGFVTEDDFNPVAMALSLLDESSLGSNRQEFDSAKQLIENSLQGTVDDHYESFATAITLHNSVLASLGNVQTSVSASRRRLRDSREALGSKRADLVQLWHRQQSVKEALRLLHTVDQLRNVPDKLEGLLSEKHFLTAVNVLVRALRTIEKPEIKEIGATSDLRAYLRSQESHILEILVEEIHNHLYLKSPYCDRRWRGYTPGEEQLPDVKWGREYPDENANGATSKKASRLSNLEEKEEDDATADAYEAPGHRGSGRQQFPMAESQVPSRLAKYLGSLSNRRVFDVNNDLGELDTAAFGASERSPPNGTTLEGNGDVTPNGEGVEDEQDATAAAEFDENPESDSFLYMEMLLEALARLGKLGVAIEAIHQRLPIEIHSLVESTIREVESRTEPMRRSSLAKTLRPESILLASSSALARTFGAGGSGRTSYNPNNSTISGASDRHGSRPLSMLLRISAAESSQVESDGEIMRDLFWTLFSKLDAVLQGHRVVHEVASVITQRPGFKENSTGAVGSSASIADKLRGRLVGGERLLDVWKPIQMEVRTLLHEYLMDDTQSPSARRNNIISINDVLKKGATNRDRSKKLFHLSDRNAASVSSGAGGGRLLNGSHASSASSNKKDTSPVKRYEERLDAALRVSVPGLVNAADSHVGVLGWSPLSTSLVTEHNILTTSGIDSSISDSSSSALMTGSHRLLVKPDAFNISVLFQPALAFVDRVRVVMPSEAAGETSKGFSAFLDEFVQDVFLPQLEDKVQSLFQGAVGGSDAFQEDTAASRSHSISSRPIVKSATNVVVLIDSLYSMLRTTPFHRERYSRLIIQTIVQYYGRCHDRFKELVSSPAASEMDSGNSSGNALMLSAIWAQHGPLSSVLAELKEAPATSKQELQDQEDQIEIQLAQRSRGDAVKLTDLITSRKKLMALGHLQHSLRWLLKHLTRLKATDESLPVSHRPTARLSVTNALQVEGHNAQIEELKLPLSSDMASRFETLPRTYSLLSDTILFTLRLELRARVLHHLELAVTEGNYLVEESSAEPDPHVVDLNAELSNLDDILADCLSPEDHRFLFEGMANLMDTMLIAFVKKVRAINRPGVSKMIRNVLALQQNLKNIVISDAGGFAAAAVAAASSKNNTADADSTVSQNQHGQSNVVSFDSSRHFWELLSKTPDEMLRAVQIDQKRRKQRGLSPAKYGFEELKSALQLMLGLDNTPAPANGADSASGSGTGGTGVSGSKTPATPTGPSAPSLRAGTIHFGREGTVSRQKLNEHLIELHQALEEE